MIDTGSLICDLCGLPLRHGNHTGAFGGQELHFCCGGCLMVYTMLMEAADSPDPGCFKESALYRRCVAAGVVPAVEEDLADAGKRAEEAVSVPQDSAPSPETLALRFEVQGMWCPACSWVIEAALGRLEGVQETVCDFATDRLRCRYDPTRVDPAAVEKTIKGLGYRPVTEEERGRRSLWREGFVRLIISALLSANVMMLSWSLYSGFFTSLSQQDIRYISWPIVIMSAVVMVYGGGPLFRKAWWGLHARAPGMEALVCLGAGSAFVYSLFNFLGGSLYLYFDTACMLVTLVLLGKLLEARAKARVRRDLEGFLHLQPRKVRMCTSKFPRGRFVALDRLAPCHRFRVAADEMVPADGEVVSGTGLVDASAVTGESRPESVGPGQGVTSGTRLLKGEVTVVARRVGPQALMGQMIDIIENSLSRPTPLESRTDRWLALFVPLMVVVAAATAVATHAMGLAWHQAFVRGLTVLVVACPCALGIAIPLARIAGISLAGRRGILVRDFEAFERVRHIDSAVMDKTGTLTHGRWSLERVTPHGTLTAHEVLALAAGLEQGIDHAIARAVRDHARQEGIEPAPVTSVAVEANGVRGTFQGRALEIGSRDFVAAASSADKIEVAPTGPLSHVYMSVGGNLCATLGFGDQVRDSAAPLVRALGAAGMQCHLISGDAPAVTREVAKIVGIGHGNAQGGQLPRAKAEFVARLQSGGRRVVMVGDGINDAPALATADLSVAVHHDASLAQQAAAVTLMRGDPGQFIDFLSLARQVNTKVVHNLGCAWIYNLISIPAAMCGWLNPLVAVTAMLLSSLTVIGNTLLLVRERKTH